MESETLIASMPTSELPEDLSAEASDSKGESSDDMSQDTIQEVSLEDICTESILQVRVKTADMRVKSYAALMSNGTEFPPIVIFKDAQSLWLADGKHRIDAAKRNGCSTIRADVRQGTERDAFLYGLQVNAAHGLALTHAEKRAAIDLMLQDPEWHRWSDREIARQCGATHPLVSKCRREMTGNRYQSPKSRKVIRGNKTVEMDTTNIGQRSSTTDQSEVMIDASSTGESDQTAEPGAPDEMEESLQPGNLASSASSLQSQGHGDQGIEAAQREDDESRSESPEAAAPNENVDPEPDKSDHGAPPEPQDASSDELSVIQASQAPLPAFQSLLDEFEGRLGDFQVEYLCDDPVVEEVIVSLEGELQRDQHLLEAHAQCLKHDGGDFDIKDTATTAHDETREHDDPDAKGHPLSSKAPPTTTAPLDPAAVVQAFLKRRCIPSCDPVSQHEVTASLHTWVEDQGLPRPTENEVTRALHQMGFRDSRVKTYNGAKTDVDWQWQGLQLLPLDAPDNEVDPFSSRDT